VRRHFGAGDQFDQRSFGLARDCAQTSITYGTIIGRLLMVSPK
jgi:hypothetical protein